MSSVNLSRRALLAGLGSMAVLGLAGCGFQPLYAARTAEGPVSDALAAIDIEPIASRPGQELRNNLIFRFTRGGTPPPAIYKLAITLTTSGQKLAVEPRSGRGEAAFVSAQASYVLRRADTGVVILQATQSANASYDQSEQRFANYRAEIDAENRAVTVLADLMRTRIAAALTRKS